MHEPPCAPLIASRTSAPPLVVLLRIAARYSMSLFTHRGHRNFPRKASFPHGSHPSISEDAAYHLGRCRPAPARSSIGGMLQRGLPGAWARQRKGGYRRRRASSRSPQAGTERCQHPTWPFFLILKKSHRATGTPSSQACTWVAQSEPIDPRGSDRAGQFRIGQGRLGRRQQPQPSCRATSPVQMADQGSARGLTDRRCREAMTWLAGRFAGPKVEGRALAPFLSPSWELPTRRHQPAVS